MREFIITSYTVWLAKHEVGCFARLSSHVHDHEHEKHWKIKKKKKGGKETKRLSKKGSYYYSVCMVDLLPDPQERL